ncbi:hypothetical protein TorRG33x02_310380 [Trema orientale]|uniref:Uncharacterized protein n=1 Tax=Trema orientale TaxID=63057 RepID=A0A2P5BSR4_TREOI|nr:hypothetical protein TorRG33x02_310380 [Trema orientale]
MLLTQKIIMREPTCFGSVEEQIDHGGLIVVDEGNRKGRRLYQQETIAPQCRQINSLRFRSTSISPLGCRPRPNTNVAEPQKHHR